MAKPKDTEPVGRLNPARSSGDGSHMPADDDETQAGSSPHADTITDEVDELGLEGRVVFERVRTRLGLTDDSPRVVGRFELRETLGRGGMGTVFLAYDPKLNREVAIKLVHTRSVPSQSKLRARLLREGQALGRLRHPNVVSIHDLGDHDGELFLAMEYVAGETLRDFQEREKAQSDEILRAYIDAGQGLAAAHDVGIVHRDFKPENVLVAKDGRVRVGDFGLADHLRATGESEPSSEHDATLDSDPDGRLTQAGEVLGTLGYMSPEQLRGEPATARSDQYAFCVSLWEALCGQRPFPGSTRDELIAATLEGRIQSGDGLAHWMRAALVQGMALAPLDRHESMDALVGILKHGLGRRGRWFRGGAFIIASIITIVSLSYAITDHSEPCPLADEITKVRAQDSWAVTRTLLDRADEGHSLQQLETHLERLALKADHVCRAGDPRLEQHLERWVEQLSTLVATASGRPLHQLLDDIDQLEQARFTRPPPRPIRDVVQDELDKSVDSGRRNQLDQALKEALHAYEQLAVGPVERAAALIRVAQVHTLNGEYQRALADFVEAGALADSGEHDDARLQAHLRAASLAVKRLEDLDRADHELRSAHALLERLHEPISSPRWAEYNDLRANVEKRRQHLNAALKYELAATLRHAVVGDRRLLAHGLLHLGTIFELQGQVALAQSCYRLALERFSKQDPDRYLVTLNLGRWLYWNGDDESAVREAVGLLRETIEGREELRVAATTTLLHIAIEADKPDTAAMDEIIRQLRELLDRAAPATPTHMFEAWRGLAFAHADSGRFGEDFDLEVAQMELVAPNQVELAEAELNLATLSRDNRDIAVRFAQRGMARLERLPATDAVVADLELAKALLRELLPQVVDQ
jgi:serine/threonine protein kinase